MSVEDAYMKLHDLNLKHSEIFDLANSFAGGSTGPIAAALHGVANDIGRTMRVIAGHYGLPMPQAPKG
jgi:hypothetical protein